MLHGHARFIDSLISLENTKYDYRNTSISAHEGEFLWKIIRDNGYHKTIEIGCALGVSSLYICDAASQTSHSEHTIIDPKQTSDWDGIGIRNLVAHGFSRYALIEKPSELALPALLEESESFDFGFIDGWHTFDHALIDFFYLNRLIRVGGMIVFDDAKWPSIAKLIRYLYKYPAYKIVLPPTIDFQSPRRNLRKRLTTTYRKLLEAVLRVDPHGFISRWIIPEWMWRKALPPIIGLKKIAADQRSWDWYEKF